MKHKAILAVILLFVCTSIRSQGIPAEGRDFYLGYLTPSFNRVVPEDTKKFFGIFAFVSAYQDTKVFVSYFDSTSGKESLPKEYFVKAGQTNEISLDTNRMKMKDYGDQFAEYRSVHITSEHPVSVMYYSQGACAGGEYLALSTASLGRNYVVGSYFDNPDGELAMLGGRGPSQLDIACGYFLVIAVHDSTNVTLIPTSTTQGGRHPGVVSGPGSNGSPQPYTVKLQRGQCYLVKSHCGSNENDISGSTVRSDKPVAVISGHENMGYGSVGSRSLEGRDYMIEQMIPVEYYSNTGFVSIPMVDSDPYNADATGENYRVYTFDDFTNIDMWIAGFSGTTTMDISKYNVRDKFEVESPVDLSSHNGSGGLGNNFNVFQFDISNQSAKAPFPRPSMMTIIPIKNWRTSYFVRGSTRSDNLIVKNYVNVIARKGVFDSIQVSKNGGPFAYIPQAGLSVYKVYQNIPNHPELMGKTYLLKDTVTYHFRGSLPFMTYNFGSRAFSSTGELVLNNSDKYTAFSAPAGHLDSIPSSKSIGFRIDTSCINYKVALWDTTRGSKIKAVMLLDDPTMDMIKPPNGTPAYASKNFSIVTGTAPYRTRELALGWSDSAVTVRIAKDNPSLEGEAYLYVVSTSGTRLIYLSNITTFEIAGGEAPIAFTSTHYNVPMDTTIVFRNVSDTESYVITQAKIEFTDPNTALVSMTPLLPAILHPGDSLKITLRVFPKELQAKTNFVSIYSDTCKVGSQEFTSSLKTGLIDVSDAHIGKIALGAIDCSKRVFVTNRGDMPFTLQNYTFGFWNYFSLTDESAAQLPKVLQPGDTLFFNVCYSPTDSLKDSAELFWITDIPAPYDSVYKRISKLTGTGAATDISWDRDSLNFVVNLSQTQQTRRAFLRNNSNSYPVISSIYIVGPDAPEFYISKTQIGGTTNLELTPFDSIYVDVTFKADLASGLKRIRRAWLVAQITSDLSIRMDLYGKVDSSQTSVKELPIADLLITPNPLTGDVVNVSFSSREEKKLSFAVYDMLGREVAVLGERVYSAGKNSLPIAIGDVSAGGYILRVSDGSSTKSISFRVVK